ncbi:hypothetical protein HN935_00525 [archaeon]|nr:hypothetical protein [archaeon]
MKTKFNVAVQTYNLEKVAHPNLFGENICEGEVNNNCISCNENITHPLCPNCISKAFNQWTKKFPEHHELKGKLNIFMRHHNHIKGKSTTCVVCNKNDVHVCPYCFTEHLYKLVKEAGLGVRAMTEFLFIFNFDFEHKGYSQELEAFGGY